MTVPEFLDTPGGTFAVAAAGVVTLAAAVVVFRTFSARAVAAVTLLVAGAALTGGGLSLIRAGGPDRPVDSFTRRPYELTPEVTAAEAAWQQARIRAYGAAAAADAEREAARPPHERWWPAFLGAGVVLFGVGVFVLYPPT